jgi:uncharacterized coiled-coil protein SlyX
MNGLREICIQVQHRVEEALQPIWTKIDFLSTTVQSLVVRVGNQEQHTAAVDAVVIETDAALKKVQDDVIALTSELRRMKSRHRDVVRSLTARIHILEQTQYREQQPNQCAQERCSDDNINMSTTTGEV